MPYKDLKSPTATSEAVRNSMVGNKGKNTKPELILRKYLHAMGYRYRTFSKGVEGKPDIVIKKYRLAVFVDGCFWHGCPKCYKPPKTNSNYWSEKKKRNRLRDNRVNAQLNKGNWTILRYWEHKILNDVEGVSKEVAHIIDKLKIDE